MALSTQTLRRDDNSQAIQHQLGLPYIGKVFYVDPTNGNDTTNGGVRPTDAYKTLAQAEDDMTSFNHDVVVLLPSGTAATAETTTIVWDKHYCHLVGATPASHMSNRSRVIWTTDAVDPAITISGNGCLFKNVQLATFQASNDVLVDLTGDRNRFEDVHFLGMGHTTAGDDTDGRHVALTGAVNNKFKDCVFGDDTIPRSDANASLGFASEASKNLFEDCFFTMNADNTGALHILSTGATGISGVNEFKNCTWMAKWTNQADKIAAVFDISAQTQTCAVLMSGNQMMVGADNWEVAASGKLWFEPHTSTANAIGIGINQS